MENFIDEVIKKKYLREGEQGWNDIAERVSKPYPPIKTDIERKRFLPAGSILANYGGGQSLSNCYYVPIQTDSIEGIMDMRKAMVKTFSWRGGVGTSLEVLRPKGEKVHNAAKSSTGSVSFMPAISLDTQTIAQCIRKGQKVITKRGLLPIERVSPTDEVWTKRGWAKVLKTLHSRKPIVTITTKMGYTFEASKDHIIMDGDLHERAIADFRVGDRVSMLFDIPIVNGQYQKIHSATYDYKRPQDAHSLRFSILNEDIAYLLGFTFGNGYISYDKFNEPDTLQLSVSSNLLNVLVRLVKTLKMMGLNPRWKTCDGECWNIRVGNKAFLKTLLENGLLKPKSYEIEIPEKVFASPSSVQMAFISGFYDADGRVPSNKNGLRVSSVSKKFLRGLQTLLAANGIASTLYEYRRKQKGWRTLWQLSVNGRVFVDKFLKTSTSTRALLGTITKLGDNNAPLFITDEITSISLDDIDDTYDLVLNGDEHLFWCEGFYVHNSGRRGAAIVTHHVEHPDVVDFIKSKGSPEEVFEKDPLRPNYVPDISGANISVKLTNAFMNAVINNGKWAFKFPDPEQYRHNDTLWNGDYSTTKLKMKTYGEMPAKDLLRLIATESWKYAEPGVLYWDNILSKTPWAVFKRARPRGVNPCLVGDTLVAVADGRNAVPIEQLAKDGKDVPVYTLDSDGNLTIEMMRNPRVTGFNEDIYEITLNDGSKIRVTANHEFRLKNGTYVQTKDLKRGDRLDVWTKVTDVNGYARIYKDGSYMFEHRFIYEHLTNTTINDGEVIHHIDGNRLNNSIKNLQKMSASNHNRIHMLGDKNPMRRFPEKNVFNDKEWQQKMRERNHIGAKRSTTTKLKIGTTTVKRMQNKEWKQLWLEKLKVANSSEEKRKKLSDTKLKVALERARSQTDLPVFIYDGVVCVDKKCEVCGKPFITPFYKRERAYCSPTCATKGSNYKKAMQKRAHEHKKILEGRRKVLVTLLARFISERGLLPLRNEFSNFLASIGENPDIRFYGFKSYLEFLKAVGDDLSILIVGNIKAEQSRRKLAKAFKNAGLEYNHKVVDVRLVGKANVYNGTVDNTHNFCIALPQENGKTVYVNSLNCGEQILPDWGNCLLGAVNLFAFVEEPFTPRATFNFDEFRKVVERAIIYLDAIIDENHHPLKEQEETDKLLRKVGLGILGLGDMLAALNLYYGSPESVEMIKKVMSMKSMTEILTTMKLAKEKGVCPLWKSATKREKEKYARHEFFKTLSKEFVHYHHEWYGISKMILENGVRNISTSTVAPTGSISIVAGNLTSGIEPLFAYSYERMSRVTGKPVRVIHPPLKAAMTPDDEKLSKEELLKKYHYVESKDLDWRARLKVQSAVQMFTMDSISSTVNLPSSTTIDDIYELYIEGWKLGLKGVTIYRDGCNLEGILKTTNDNDDDEKSLDMDNPSERKVWGEILLKKIDLSNKENALRLRMMWKNRTKTYITVTYSDDGYPVEVFAKVPKEAGYNDRGDFVPSLYLERQGLWDSLCRMISLNLQYGISVKEVLKQLDKSSYSMYDLPAILKRAIEKVMQKVSHSTTTINYDVCPECGEKKLVKEGGCEKCLNCGYSKCS